MATLDFELPPATQNPYDGTPYKASLSASTQYPALARWGIQAMDCPAFWVAVCIPCKLALNPKDADAFISNVKTHYTKKHNSSLKSTEVHTKQAKEEVAQLSSVKPMLTRANAAEMVPTLPPLINEVSWLQCIPGWACTFKGCRFVSRNQRKQKHWFKVHNPQLPAPGTDGTEPCTIQSLDPACHHSIFRVRPVLNAVKPGNGLLEFLKASHDDPTFEDRLRPQIAITGDPRQHLDALHAKTLWPIRVQKYSVADLISLVRLPKSGSEDPLSKLVPASRTWITSLDESIQDVDPIHLRRLTENFNQYMFRTISPVSHENYARAARKLGVFALRAVRRDLACSEVPVDPPAANWDFLAANENEARDKAGRGAEDDSEDSDDEVEDSDDEDKDSDDEDEEDKSDDEGDLDSDDDEPMPDVEGDEEDDHTDAGSSTGAIYPVFFTDHQKTVARNLWDALEEEDSTPQTIERRFHDLLLALFTDIDETSGRRVYTPVEAFLFISNVRQNGTIRNAGSIANGLSRVQYAILFSIIREAIASEDVGQTLNHLSRWFDPKQVSPFAGVRYLQGVAVLATRNAVSPGRILFYAEAEPEFQFDGVDSSVLNWIQFVQKMWREANNISTEIVFRHSDEEFQITEFQQSHTDNPSNTDLGYGFAPLSKEHEKKILGVVWDQFHERHFRQDAWSAITLLDSLSQIHRLKALIFGILHIACGGPKRISELLLASLWNMLYPRSVYLILKRFFLVGGYSKTSNLTGAHKLTLHLIPPAMERLFVRLCLVILPIERTIIYILNTHTQRRILEEPNGKFFLFSSYGKRWTADEARSLLKRLTKKYLGQRFGAAQIRQQIPAIIEHCGVDLVEQPVAGAVTSTQMAHSLAVHVLLYKRRQDLPNHISYEKVLGIIRFSAAWHGLLGFAECDGPTEVTADGLKRFIRELHPNRNLSLPPEFTDQLNAIRQHQLGEQDAMRRQLEEVRRQLQASEEKNAELRRELALERQRRTTSTDAARLTQSAMHLQNSQNTNRPTSNKRSIDSDPVPLEASEGPAKKKTRVSPEAGRLCPECDGQVEGFEDHFGQIHKVYYSVMVHWIPGESLGRVFRRKEDGHLVCVCGQNFRRTAEMDTHLHIIIESGELGTPGTKHFIENFRGAVPEGFLGYDDDQTKVQ
ncbi:hypothetical protein B0H16DRAFT_1767524 [Mycena metata]|uniref:Uncharacterized protein n=1 Tax=Mycena metata TaxID=1033252 RepID=A0AAD7I3L2_9AGAR|nr:hypothetical protein B0H16DRAFT_1767524 [Mycena metata]